MNALHAHIQATAVTIAAQAKPSSVLTVAKLADFMQASAADTMAALATAPRHVREAFNLERPGHDRKAVLGLFPRRAASNPWKLP